MKLIKNYLALECASAGENITQSGIILKSQDTKKPIKAKVLFIGPEVKWVKSGDEVWFVKGFSVEYEIAGNKYTFLREEDIIAID